MEMDLIGFNSIGFFAIWDGAGWKFEVFFFYREWNQSVLLIDLVNICVKVTCISRWCLGTWLNRHTLIAWKPRRLRFHRIFHRQSARNRHVIILSTIPVIFPLVSELLTIWIPIDKKFRSHVDLVNFWDFFRDFCGFLEEILGIFRDFL